MNTVEENLKPEARKKLNTKLSGGLPLLIIGLVAGVLGTAVIMSRMRPAAPGPTQVAAEGADGDEHGEKGGPSEGEEHAKIELSPEALKTAGIRVQPVGYISMGETLTVPGVVEVTPNRGAKITPPAPGKVVRLMANLGDTVRTGQELLELDSYEVAQAHSEVKQAESRIKDAQAALQTAQAEVSQAQSGVRFAEAEIAQARTKVGSAETVLRRQRELAATGAFSQPSLQAAQAEVSEAQSELLQAQTDMQSHLVALQRAEKLFREELVSRQELEQAQLENRQDQARVERAKTRVDIARRTLEREQKVFGGDILNRQAVQTAEAEVRSAQGEVQKAIQGRNRAVQDVRRAEKGSQAARTALRGALDGLQAAKSNLYALEGSGHAEGEGGRISIVAPISGVITARNASVGEAVERTATLMVVENLQTVLVNAQVPEKDVARVRIGLPVTVTAASYPNQRFSGVVQSVAGRVDEKTRALAVRCLVENPNGLLKPDMFARVMLSVGKSQRVIAVPEDAVDADEEPKAVFVSEDDHFEKRSVEVGRTVGKNIEILSGLKAGERIAVEGVFVLKSELKKAELKGHAH